MDTSSVSTSKLLNSIQVVSKDVYSPTSNEASAPTPIAENINQLKFQETATRHYRQTTYPTNYAGDSVLSDRQPRSHMRDDRRSDGASPRSGLPTNDVNLSAYSDIRQNSDSASGSMGQLTKADVSVFEDSLMQKTKSSVKHTDRDAGKTNREKSIIDKPTQSGGFLESNHSQSVSSTKGTAATVMHSISYVTQNIIEKFKS